MEATALLVGGFVVAGPTLLVSFILRNLRTARRLVDGSPALGISPTDGEQLDPCRCCIGGLHDHAICQHPDCPGWKK